MREKSKVAEALDALNKETASIQDVEAIIGNGSWTRLTCDECSSEVDAVIRMGQEPDYESSTALLCFSCVKKAAEMINRSTPLTGKWNPDAWEACEKEA